LIVEGRIFQLILLIVATLCIMYYIQMARGGKEIRIRSLAAVDAIDEVVGRASEMGRPVHYTFGTGQLTSSTQAPQLLSSMGILGRVATRAADLGVEFIVTSCQADTLPMVEDIIRNAYMMAGKGDEYREDIIRFLSTGFAYRAAVIGILEREKPAANFIIGGYYNETLTFAETATRIGAQQIGGTANTHQLPFIAAVCDYSLLAEELYAAGAYIRKQPEELGSIAGQDLLKFIVIIILILGVLLNTAGNDSIIQLLSM
jgi:hypothetical protein